jgi:hypothetical protein
MFQVKAAQMAPPHVVSRCCLEAAGVTLRSPGRDYEGTVYQLARRAGQA